MAASAAPRLRLDPIGWLAGGDALDGPCGASAACGMARPRSPVDGAGAS
jgi:hypothetical protein